MKRSEEARFDFYKLYRVGETETSWLTEISEAGGRRKQKIIE